MNIAAQKTLDTRECDLAAIDLAACQDVLGRALSVHVGRGRGWSVAALGLATGIKMRSIESWRAGEATPSMHALMRLMAALGPAFANRLIALAALGGAHELGDGTSSLALNAKATSLSALIGAHMEDGRIDHCELAAEIEPVRALHAACGGFLSAHDGCA